MVWIRRWSNWFHKVTKIPVTWVSLNTSSITFSAKNATQQLTATVAPNDATDKTVTWTSSNTGIATVSSTWLVTCKWAWTCTITVTTQDGGYTATCSITAQRLPIAYQEVQYLENTGSSYINTNLTYNSAGRVYQLKYWPVWWRETLWGNFPSWSESDWHTRYSKLLSNNALEWDCYAWGGYGRISYTPSTQTRPEEIELWNNYIKDIPTNTVLVSWATWSYVNSSATIKIFYRDSSINGGYATFKLYYFKIIDNGSYVRNFVPCYRKSDNVRWLYDLANNVFYVNQWSWTFSIWSNVYNL